MRELVSSPRNEPHARTVPQRQKAEAIMLDFVQPTGAGRRRALAGEGKHGSIIPSPGRVGT